MQPHGVVGTLFIASFASAGIVFFHLRDLCLTLYMEGDFPIFTKHCVLTSPGEQLIFVMYLKMLIAR